jgi:hypothetical protein
VEGNRLHLKFEDMGEMGNFSGLWMGLGLEFTTARVQKVEDKQDLYWSGEGADLHLPLVLAKTPAAGPAPISLRFPRLCEVGKETR